MLVGNLEGRVILIGDNGSYVDVADASAGRFSADPGEAYERWDELAGWAATVDFPVSQVLDPARLGPPVPTPRQVFAVGLNYSEHAAESGFAVPEQPTIFTKFVSCLAGPYGTVELPAEGHTDWEVELVAVIGRRASQVSEADAWSFIAGLTIGQDISERITQSAGPAPQFSLGKSFPGFGPTGPWVVSTDEFENLGNLELGCTVNGQEMQRGRTKDLIFSVPRLVSALSQIVTLYPGDLIFTGTPAGVGLGRVPPVWLREGDELISWIEGIGEIRQRFVAAAATDRSVA
jgi:2,4-didehydro-3-deoxy-L-rhamnonate hydrolase